MIAAAGEGGETADHDPDDARDDEDHAFVGRRARDDFLGFGGDGIARVEAEEEKDDAGNEDRKGECFVHGRELRRSRDFGPWGVNPNLGEF